MKKILKYMLIFLIVSCDTLIPDDLNINPNSPSEAPEDLVFMKVQLQEGPVFGLDILEELIGSMRVLTIIL